MKLYIDLNTNKVMVKTLQFGDIRITELMEKMRTKLGWSHDKLSIEALDGNRLYYNAVRNDSDTIRGFIGGLDAMGYDVIIIKRKLTPPEEAL